MIVKNYSCDSFAGIKNTDIDFKDGLNVIVGDNEAGKSTVVEGIFSVLFKSSKIDSRATADKEFVKKFMPIAKGDSIDGKLTVTSPDGDYKLSKEWGASPSSKLVTPDSEILRDEDNIAEVLKDILLFGEGTYSNVLFSRQQFLKEAIKKITDDPQTTGEVSSLLRKAVMELDGVSLEELGQQIDSELENLLKKWDVKTNYPQGNRGVNNPYLVGLGEVISAYYAKEKIKLAMDGAEKAEKQFEKICAEMNETEAAIAQTKTKIEDMDKIAEDVNAREIIEPKLARYEKDLAVLSKINSEWPVNLAKLEMLSKELKKLQSEYQTLENEKALVKKAEEKKALAERIAKVDMLKQDLEALKKKSADIQLVTAEDVAELEKNSRGMNEAKVAMSAGTMYGQIKKLDAKTGLTITKDLDEPMELRAGENFNADGFIKLIIDNKIEIEIKSGEADFMQLREQYTVHKEKIASQLAALRVESVEGAKLNVEKLANLNRESKACRERIEETLDGESYESINDKIKTFEDLSQVRPLETIEAEMKKVDSRKTEVTLEINTLEVTTQQWSDDYKNIDGLLDKMLEIRAEQKTERDKLEKLAPLPEEYADASDFKTHLASTRVTYDNLSRERVSQKDEYYAAEKNVPESSYEEFESELEEAEERFEALLKKADKMQTIKEAYNETRESMDSSSFDGVIESFSKNIAILTNDSYSVGDIDDEFNIQIQKDDQTVLPLDLLSTGTHDSVALALRLAILESILGENKGFLVLDDCLVDLDPKRKAKAAALIKEFSEKHQVIFTTCSPDTAGLLGGNTIRM